jgi:hypothetical protein
MGRALSQGPDLAEGVECVAELARLFPEAVPVRIPVRVSRGNAVKAVSEEHTVIEFGTPEEILFVSGLPLDFDDTVRVRNANGSLNTAAKIVAMRLHNGKMAVAARFMEDVANWIITA